MESIKSLIYNLAQYIFVFCVRQITFLEWGRGTGKSTIIGKRIIDCVEQMPRSTGVLVGETFASIKTRTLPSTIAGMEQHGYFKDVHYVVGKKPPESWKWKEPYEPPLDYKNCVIFYNGTVLLFISQDATAASGRGLNIDWFVGDEAARLNEQLFETDIMLTNRGNLYRKAEYPDGSWKYFKECELHHSGLLASTTPVTAKGQWVLKYEEQARLNPDKFLFLRASAEVNRHNLGDDYFENAKAIMPDFLYAAEVENKRISRIEDGFYPSLNEDKHCYNQFNIEYYTDLQLNTTPTCLGDDDLWREEPLILGIDFGANINCLVVAQEQGNQLSIIKNLYVKSPKIIENLINDEFVPYYEQHINKKIYLWYDPAGNTSVANARQTYAEEVVDLLTKAGWQVEKMTSPHGFNEQHTLKFKLWNDVLKERDDKYPVVRFNKSNCQELWISMTQAPAKQGNNHAIQKNKNSERNKKVDQAHATHFSDAVDLIVVGMFMDKQFNTTPALPPMMR